MTDHLIRAVELLAKIAERLAMVDARLGEGVERIMVAVAALSKQLTAGGVRAGKAEKALGEKVEALPTSEVLGAMFADLRARAKGELPEPHLQRIFGEILTSGQAIGAPLAGFAIDHAGWGWGFVSVSIVGLTVAVVGAGAIRVRRTRRERLEPSAAHGGAAATPVDAMPADAGPR